MIIGLSGFARAGKDTVADILVEKHGFTKIAYADKLRDFLYAQNPIVGNEVAPDWKDNLDAMSMNTIQIRLRDVIDFHTWEGYKNSEWAAEIRPLIQRTGTEAGRNTLWDNIWIDATFKAMEPGRDYVISDARFLNELIAISYAGGHTMKVLRPGVFAANDHPSETEHLKYSFDHVINNDSTLAGLCLKVDQLMRVLRPS